MQPMSEGPCHTGTTLQTMTTVESDRESGGGERDRTDDLLVANQALSQLSYTPDLTLEYQMAKSRAASLSTRHLIWWA